MRHRSSPKEHDDEQELELYKQLYHSRRLHDRLSYENLLQTLDQEPTRPSLATSTGGLISQNNLQRGEPLYADAPSRSYSKLPVDEQRQNVPKHSNNTVNQLSSLSEVHPNAEIDFHPKNRNWRHFEHFNEEDRERDEGHRENCRPTFITYKLNGQHGQAVDSEDVDDAKSVSSEGSGSSEEQFVWMHHKHHRNKDTTKKASWLRRKIPTRFVKYLPSESVANRPIHEGREVSVDTLERVPPPQSARRSVSGDWDHRDFGEKPETRRQLARRSLSSPDLDLDERRGGRSLMGRLWSFHDHTGDDADSAVTPISHREIRAQYNARIMPEKLVMIRHGQSMGNINELLYSTVPDNAMPLTDLGWEQAQMAGKVLKQKIIAPGETVHFIVSPYVRTVETFLLGLLDGFRILETRTTRKKQSAKF